MTAGALVIAHRTCPLDAPENSREGVAYAAAVGADVVEVDVRLSRDGVPVMVHDPVTLRTTGWPFVVGWTSARRLTSLRLRSRADRRGDPEGRALSEAQPRRTVSRDHVLSPHHLKDTDETLPAFSDVLEVLPDGLELAVDVKDGVAMGAAIDALERAGCLDRARLWSSHPEAVDVAARRAPDNERAWLHNTLTESAAIAYARDAADKGATAISVMDVSLTSAVVAYGHDLGLAVHSWVRALSVQDEVLACGPDGIVTDWPAEARRQIDEG